MWMVLLCVSKVVGAFAFGGSTILEEANMDSPSPFPSPPSACFSFVCFFVQEQVVWAFVNQSEEGVAQANEAVNIKAATMEK